VLLVTPPTVLLVTPPTVLLVTPPTVLLGPCAVMGPAPVVLAALLLLLSPLVPEVVVDSAAQPAKVAAATETKQAAVVNILKFMFKDPYGQARRAGWSRVYEAMLCVKSAASSFEVDAASNDIPA
jgi:hypothetical protein